MTPPAGTGGTGGRPVPNQPDPWDDVATSYYERLIDSIEPPMDSGANGHGKTRNGAHPEPTDLFKRWTPAELIDALTDFRWLVKGYMAQPTFGQIAGELKTLKTYVAGCTAVGIASGQPIFDTFHVPEPGPVLLYCGEGGRDPLTRRLIRIAQGAGVDFRHLPISVIVESAPLSSIRFRESLQRDLDDLQPSLVIIDPLYAYHGTDTAASNLHEEGTLLTSVTEQATAADANLFFVNHFNQTGGGKGLKRITMAGSGEHVDSWYLLSHREVPNVASGRFHLLLEVGSRQWGGTSWDLDLTLGSFDIETGTHDGPITWSCTPAKAGAGTGAGGDDEGGGSRKRSDDERDMDVIHTLKDHDPYQLTETALVDTVGGDRKAVRQAIKRLTKAGLISWSDVAQPEGTSGRTVTRSRAAHTPREDPHDTPL